MKRIRRHVMKLLKQNENKIDLKSITESKKIKKLIMLLKNENKILLNKIAEESETSRDG